MKEIIEKVTNFINENTMLLIGICAFLILALIVYLIDNSIKTKKMQKALTEIDKTEDNVIESSSDIETKKEGVKNDEPVFDSISLDNEPEEKKEEVVTEEPKIETPAIEEEVVETPVVETPAEVKTEEPKFTNKKSLSEILSKKKESIDINDTDKTLEETTEFNNTF